MATVYEIVQGLAQAAANSYDGALGEDYEPVNDGILRREEGNALIDQRVMDGFNVKFYGNMMCLSYQSDVQLKEVYASDFEGEMEQRLTDIAGWLKKEYKKITGNSVALTEEGEIDVFVQNSSRVRTWVQAKKHYKVGGLAEEMNDDNSGSTNPLETNWKSFLDQGGWNGKGGTRPDNDTRKKEKLDEQFRRAEDLATWAQDLQRMYGDRPDLEISLEQDPDNGYDYILLHAPHIPPEEQVFYDGDEAHEYLDKKFPHPSWRDSPDVKGISHS